MLTGKEQREAEKLVNFEYMSQVEGAETEAVLDGVKLAIIIMRGQVFEKTPVGAGMAMVYLEKFGNLKGMRGAGLPERYIRELYCRNYSDGDGNDEEWKAWYVKDGGAL